MANPDISYDYTNALYERPSSKPEDYGEQIKTFLTLFVETPALIDE